MTNSEPGLTVIMYENAQLAILEGAVSLPIGTRVEVGPVDYIIDTARLSVRGAVFDIYYEAHRAEETGTRTDPRD